MNTFIDTAPLAPESRLQTQSFKVNILSTQHKHNCKTSVLRDENTPCLTPSLFTIRMPSSSQSHQYPPIYSSHRRSLHRPSPRSVPRASLSAENSTAGNITSGRNITRASSTTENVTHLLDCSVAIFSTKADDTTGRGTITMRPYKHGVFCLTLRYMSV